MIRPQKSGSAQSEDAAKAPDAISGNAKPAPSNQSNSQAPKSAASRSKTHQKKLQKAKVSARTLQGSKPRSLNRPIILLACAACLMAALGLTLATVFIVAPNTPTTFVFTDQDLKTDLVAVPDANREAEDEALIKQINESGAKLVFISLGCPKQEYWIASHKNKINAVMIGLGGVFPVYAGLQKYAPKLFRKFGLEWLYRLLQEPRRLWKYYENTILVFLFLALGQIFTESLIATTSSCSEKIKQDLPEEWISDLESLKVRLLKLNIPEWEIRRKIFFVLLTMFFAKIRINIENTWLFSRWNSRKTD